MDLNLLDLSVLIIVGLSALLSFFRGLIREILSLGGWVGASIITLRFMPAVSTYIKPQVKSEAIANGIASVGLFFITLILISIVASMLLKVLKIGDKVGLFDNLGGLAFGVARGVLIVSIAYFAMTLVIVEKDYPAWVKQAASRPYIEQTTKWLASLAPEYLDKITGEGKAATSDTLGEESKKQMNNLLKKLDDTRDNAAEKIGATRDAVDEETNSLPSIEELHQRIKEENERP